MDKMKMHTTNKADENFEKLAAMFPNAVTETIDENGIVVRAIDKDVLMQEISCKVVEGREERYQFTWPDKKKSVLTANAPINKTLRPVREDETVPTGSDSEGNPYSSTGSVNFDSTENLYIEGDNLEVLKLLQETYLGKIKMIYIDPPYNTGNDFVYEDDFAQSADEYISNSGQLDEEGNRLVANTESNGRFHTDWLNMIYPRLRLAKDLLTDDGVIFISIDDNEVSNLKKICDEIFGADNIVAQLTVQLNPRGRNLDRYIAKTHEYVLIYVKNYLNTNCILGVEKEGKMVEEYNKEDERGKYRLIGLRNRNQAFNPTTRPNLYYPLYVDSSSKKVSTKKDTQFTDEVWPDTPDGIKTCWTWMSKKVDAENNLITAELSNGEWRVFRKDYLVSEDGKSATTLVKSIWTENTINNDYGKKAIKELFGSNLMSFPKPPELVKRMIAIGSRDDSIILDFFSGSATTAHAVMQLNAEDRGNRKLIMVQLPEVTDEKSEAYKAGYKNICEIGKERIRRVAKKIAEENPNAKFDGGFRVLKCDSSNMKDVYYNPEQYEANLFTSLTDNIKEDRTPEDLLFQVMLDLGVELSSKIAEYDVAGKKVFNVADGFLIACFDDDVTEETIKAVAKLKPYYFVMRDSSMANDSVATNFEQLFATYSPETVRKVL
jgi:site-specific DNA-methyltransferase (adenine-specific)